jgi:hypothetical protein
MFKVPQVMNSSFKVERSNDKSVICVEDIESGDEPIVFPASLVTG